VVRVTGIPATSGARPGVRSGFVWEWKKGMKLNLLIIILRTEIFQLRLGK